MMYWCKVENIVRQEIDNGGAVEIDARSSTV